jgi:hypothetical protein
MLACESYWEISPYDLPTKAVRDDVRQRLHTLRTPNRKNVGKAVDMPLDFVDAAVDYLVDQGLLPDSTIPSDSDGWAILLDTIAVHLGVDYATLCNVVAPPELDWNPPAADETAASADPPEVPTDPGESHTTVADASVATSDAFTTNASPSEPPPSQPTTATSSELIALIDQLRTAGAELSDALQSARRGIDEAQLIDTDLAGLSTTWNTALTELAVRLHGHEKYVVGFEQLEAEVERVSNVEKSRARLQEALADKAAKLQNYRAQCNNVLFEEDADYRALVEQKIVELELELSQLAPAGGDAVSGPAADDNPPSIAVRDEAEPGDQVTEADAPPPNGRYETSASEAAAEPAVLTGTPFAHNGIPEDIAAGVASTEDGGVSTAEAAPTQTGAPPTGVNHTATADEETSTEDDTAYAEDDKIDRRIGHDKLNTPAGAADETSTTDASDDGDAAEGDGPERGLAELITRNQWPAASALAAITDLDASTVQALNFCAESFCLPIISTDPHEMLGRNAGSIAEALQSSTTAAVLTAVGLLRVCLHVGREQSWLLTEEFLDCVPGRWRDVARGLRDAVADGYQHHWDHAAPTSSSVPPAALKRQAEELKETLPKRGNKYARAGNVLRHMMGADGDLALALDAVSAWADGAGDVESLRAQRTTLEDPRKLVDRVDVAISGRPKQKKAPIISTAFESLAARITEVAGLLDQAIVLAEPGGAKHRPPARPVVDRVGKLIQDLPEVEIDGTLGAAALERFRAWLISGTGPSSETGRSFAQLKFVSTLPAVSAVRDQQRNLPVSSDVSPQTLIEELLQPRPETELFHAYLESGNLAAAATLGGDGDEALALRTAEREWRNQIDRRALDLQSELLRLQAQTRAVAIDRAQLEGKITALGSISEDRFDIASSRSDEIASELEGLWANTRRELSDSLHELDLTVGIGPGNSQRIRSLIEQSDFITAREFMSLLTNASGQPLPQAHDDGLVALQEFRALLEDWPDGDVSAHHVVQDTLGGPPPDQVATALRAWNQAGRVRKPSELERLLPSILGLIGLDKIPDLPISDKTERNQNRLAKFTIKAKPNGGSYIAALGSRTRKKGYTVYTVLSGNSVDSVFDQIPTGERREANLVFYPGVLSWEDRKALRASAEKKKVTALIVDNAVIAHMACQQERSFTTLQRVTLPFSIFQHWAPRVAGDVPDELFVGRVDLIDRIVSPEGSIFVYGGRQLGKSALLHRIERDFNRLDKKLAIYIDFKVERIGEQNEPEHLWTVLRNRLQEQGIIPAANTSTKSEAIEKAIRDWLDADPDRAILLLCDEADAFLQNEARERMVNNRVGSFPNVTVLKGLMDKTHRRFKPVFAGLHQVQRIADIPNSPLAHGGEDILVGPLEPPEAWDLVVRPFKALGFQFESLDLVWRLLAFTNHHAGLVQIVCDELYKKMRSGQTRITPGEPPYIIRASDVDSVITSRDVRDFIKERFQLTIQLEDRYFVIAMVVALLSLDSGFENRYSQSEILDFCRMFWPGGFSALTEDELSVYLDEMVGLNVLINGNDVSHYGMRSPNVVHMLGDRETIEKQLADGRFELPLQYNARVSRRRLSQARGVEKYSPLSEYELSRVMPKHNRTRDCYAVAVIGSPALGIGDVGGLLNAASQEDYEYNLKVVSPDDAKELVRASPGVIARRPLIVCDAVDRPECLQDVVERISAARTDNIGRRAVLLGAFGAAVRHELAAYGVEVIPLQLWTIETVRATIDNPITDPTQRDKFVEATGGWPALCEEFLGEIRTGTAVADVISRAKKFPDDPDQARSFLSAVGMTDGHDLALLRPWASFARRGDVLDVDTLGELLEIGADELTPLLDRLTVLSVVSEHAEGYVLNDVVRRSLITVGATDAR